MIESYRNAVEEFKRVDHLYYVTLKYTRTVDVIRSMMERLITTYEHGIDTILKVLKEEKQIDHIPNNPVGKAELAKKHSSQDIASSIGLYLAMRKMLRLEYTKREEFRRHVTMTVILEGEAIAVNIDLLKEYYDDTALFISHLKSLVENYT